MKLIFIGNTAWSMYNFRRPVFEHFLKQGCEVVVASSSDAVYENLLQLMGCRFRSVDMESKGKNPMKDFKTMWQIRCILREERPDICFFYTIKPNVYGGIAATLTGIPFVPVTTGLGYVFLVDNIVSKIAKFLYKMAFRKAVQVWFLNQDDVDAFKQARLVPDDKISVLRGEGIDVGRFELHDNSESLSFILVARMLWDKGVGEFVESARILKEKYPSVKFKLLGFLGVDNPSAISKEQMDEWVDEGVIDYLGAVNDVRPFLYDSTCVVLPSSYREGIPFSLMEGAAAGKPLIATNGVGCKEVVEDGVTGFLCGLKDVHSLSCCMEKIVQMPEAERRQMGLRGREKMENEFGIRLVIQKYDELVKSLHL